MNKKIFKIILSNLFLISLIFNQNAYSKPVPPGSGEGDVPANILILLDSSLSMQNKITSGATLTFPYDIVEDEDGNVIATGGSNQGVIKILTATEVKDPDFGHKGRFKGANRDGNCGRQDSSMLQPNNLGISSNVLGHSGQVIIASESNNDMGKIVFFDKNGKCLDVLDHWEIGNFRPRAMTVRTIGNQDFMMVAGNIWQRTSRRRGYWRARMYTRNLTTGVSRTCDIDGGDFRPQIAHLWSMSMDDGNYLYVANRYTRHIEGYALSFDGNTYCPTDSTKDREYADARTGNAIRSAEVVEVDPDDSDVLWVGSYAADTLQKVTLTSDTTLTLDATKGSYGKGDTTSDSDVNMIDPYGLYVTSDKVYVGVRNPTILQFANDSSITWQNQMGGGAKTRLQGAKDAIKAVVSDSSLTSGANFGYGHWNSGRGFRNKWHKFGQHTCHFTTKGKPRRNVKNGNDNCPYWDGWTGSHPDGRSTLCNKDSCIMVGVHAEGYTKIPRAVDATRMAWGTDGNAFSRMAWGYFTSKEVDIIDTNSPCQLNYVIVISDGAWTHSDKAEALIEKLRQEHKVETLVVAYGGGVDRSLDRYKRMARAGSCDVAGSADCKEYIKADTPQELKTHLQSAIQQIIADRLSFTAPSITATIQEGGSLYQAQFDYKQYGEWQGTILRKGIDANQKVCHDPDPQVCPGNWDASEELKQQAQRNIWTTLPSKSYIGNWNNWTTENSSEIEQLFDVLENRVLDYHHANSKCKGTTGVTDDIDGLINFVRGQDYFDYNGDCDITEKRDWDGASMLGDIYHSQIVEIGPPNANHDFTSTNEESFWRSTNNYASFVRTHANRRNVIYAGANDGMLHAFSAETGQEEWAFVPPFIAGKLPTIINVNLDGKVDGNNGGSNAIFGVDGSPVVHDMFISGLNENGEWEETKKWRTILIIPYGRGGAGFSVLDVTRPILKEGQGPMHMFSIFNDQVLSRVLVADNKGSISTYPYLPETILWESSREARRAIENNNTAHALDEARGDDLDTEQDLIYECETQAQNSNDFALNSSKACYKGNIFTFDFPIPADTTLTTKDFRFYEGEDDIIGKTPVSVSYSDGIVTINLGIEKYYNASRSDLVPDDGSTETSQVTIKATPSLAGVTQDDYKYNYSKLGETWSTPRVFRIPDPDSPNSGFSTDIYTFVMGGGMGSAVGRSGSNVFVVDLEDREFPGAIAGAKQNHGPISIIDTEYTSSTPNGSDIANAIPSSPVVITPDNALGIEWRGAMVYVNDLEGKITKINLTNLPGTKLFEQRTIANLGATRSNARLSYHSMDASIGRDTKRFWLFGATGHYERINDTTEFDNDNILYGIKDDHRSFETAIPLEGEVGYNSWVEQAREHADQAPRVDNLNVCMNITDDTEGLLCPKPSDLGWVFYLNDMADNRHIKATATPRVYKGNVYFPIYSPTLGKNRCNLGDASICSADDECGTNNSKELAEGEGKSLREGEKCFFITQGILSELVVFANTMWANVAGPSDTEDTLVSILAGSGEISTYRRSWREGF